MATLRTTVLSKKVNNKFPILICISQKTERAYIQTGIYLDDTSEFENGIIVYRKDAKSLNRKLLFTFEEYKEKFDKINDGTLKPSLIKRKLVGSRVSFIEYWTDRISDFRKDGRMSYSKMNEDTLKLFIQAEGEINIECINHSVVEHFTLWLKKRGHTQGGISIRLSHLKARVNELIKTGVLRCDIHPFVYTKVPASLVRKCDIELEDFIRLKQYSTESKGQLFAKDMLMLSFYLGGINFADIHQGDFSSETFKYNRKKSSRKLSEEIVIPILPEARAIINKYIKNERLELGYNFTYRNLQSYINRELKKIGNSLNIKGICFYSARKSFAQYASELGIPDSVIDYLLGHSDKNRGIIRYYTKVRYKQAEIALKRVVDYVNNPDAYKDYIEMRADIMMMR